MPDVDTSALAPGAPIAPPPPAPTPDVDFSNVPAFRDLTKAYNGPTSVPTMWQNLNRPSPFSQQMAAGDPLSSIGPAVVEPLAKDAQAAVQDPGSMNLWQNFDNGLKTGAYAVDSTRRENALADSIAQHIDNIKQATGVELPNPTLGGFSDQASQQVLDRIKNGERLSPLQYSDEVQKAQFQLYQNAIQDLAAKHQTGSLDDASILTALNAATSMNDYADQFVKDANAQEAATYAKSSGSFLPWLASTAGEMTGSFRNPINLMGLAVGGPAPKAATAIGRVLEAGAHAALINMGLTGVQEPERQGRLAQLGEENGLVPALKDVGTSGLFGFVPGAVLRGIHEVGSAFSGPSSPEWIEEFLRQAQGIPADGPTTAAGRAHMDAVHEWEREHGLEEGSTYRDLGLGAGATRAPPPGPTPPPAGGPRRPAAAPPTASAASEPPEAPRAPLQIEKPLWEGKPYPETPDPSPAVQNAPRTTEITPARIEAAELDHAAAPPNIEGVDPGASLAAYHGMVLHGENPDTTAPPIIPQPAPPSKGEGVPPDNRGAAPPTPGQTGTIDGKPVSYTQFDPRTLGTDADAFQYKGNSNAQGVTDRLAGVQEWNPLASGNVVVFERADGKRFIVDGHQRLGLSTWLLNEGHSPIMFNGALLKESDGWTPRDARAIAAKKNIQEGSGETLDTARVLRDRPDMWDRSLPTSSPKLRQAKGLADLSDEGWGMMLNGVVPENYASLVGQGVPDKGNHAAILADMAKYKPKNENEARMLIADANAAGFRQETQDSLFGPEQATRTLMGERMQVYSSVISLLHDDKKIFGMLDREAEKIEGAGNRLVDTNATQAQRAGQLAQILEKLATRQGPVSAALNRAAQSVADAKDPRKAVMPAARSFIKDIDRLIREEGLRLEAPPAFTPKPPEHDIDTPAGRAAQTQELETKAEEIPDDMFAEPSPPARPVAPVEPPSVTADLTAPADILDNIGQALKTGSIDASRFSSPPTTEQIDQIIAKGREHEDAEVDRLFGDDAKKVKKWMRSSTDKAVENLTDLVEEKYGPGSEQEALVFGIGDTNTVNVESLERLRDTLSNIEFEVDRAAQGDDAGLTREIAWLAPKLPEIDAAPEAHTEVERIATLGLARAFEDMEAKGVAVGPVLRKAVNYSLQRVGGDRDDAKLLMEKLAPYVDRYAPKDAEPEPERPKITSPLAATKEEAAAEKAWKAARKKFGNGSREEVDARTVFQDKAGEANGDHTPWQDIGGGYSIRQGLGERADRQEIKTPSGNLLIRGLDTNGQPYQEFEVTTTNPFAKGAMNWVTEAEDYLRAHMGGARQSAPMAPEPVALPSSVAQPLENAARAVTARAKEVLAASGTPIDQVAHQIIEQHVEPFIDQAFPKPIEATGAPSAPTLPEGAGMGLRLAKTVSLRQMGLKPKSRAPGGDWQNAAAVAWKHAKDTGRPQRVLPTAFGWKLSKEEGDIPYGTPYVEVDPQGNAKLFEVDLTPELEEPAPTPEPEPVPSSPPKTPEVPASALSHAADMAGRVVYHNGDVALIRAFSVLNGKPVYIGAKGDMRARFDIESDKTNLFTPSERADLVAAKRAAVAEAERANALNPSGPFAEGARFAASPSVPKNLADFTQRLLNTVGIKARVYLTTAEDAKGADFHGPFAAIGSGGLDAQSYGTTRRLPNGDHYIVINPQPDDALNVEAVSHEVGHIVQKELWENAPPAVRRAVREEYEAWRASMQKPGVKARDLIRSTRPAHAAEAITLPNEDLAAERLAGFHSYWTAFNEWFADQTARWATSSKKPLSIVDKFFASIAAAFRKIHEMLGKQFEPVKSMKDWLDSLRPTDVEMDEEISRGAQEDVSEPIKSAEELYAENETKESEGVRKIAQRIVDKNADYNWRSQAESAKVPPERIKRISEAIDAIRKEEGIQAGIEAKKARATAFVSPSDAERIRNMPEVWHASYQPSKKEISLWGPDKDNPYRYYRKETFPASEKQGAKNASVKINLAERSTTLTGGISDMTHYDRVSVGDEAPQTALATEPGPEGTRQTLMPGVAPVTDRERLQAAAAKPLRGGNRDLQHEGLFGDGQRQKDIFDTAPTMPEQNLRERIQGAMLEAGNGQWNKRVPLSELRAKLPDVSREELDAELKAMHVKDGFHLSGTDNPAELRRAPEVAAAGLNYKGEPMHYAWQTKAPVNMSGAPSSAPRKPSMDDMVMTENGLVDRQKLIESVPHEAVLSKLIGECEL